MIETTDQTKTFKEVMANYPTGVTIVTTTAADGHPVGLTVNSFASVSLDPLLLLWSIDHKASSLNVFKSSDKFAVHVLASDQENLCKLFASKNVDRFSQCEWAFSNHHLPVLNDVAAILQCSVFKSIEAGDHTILIGKVLEIDKKEKAPLLYHRGKTSPLGTDSLL